MLFFLRIGVSRPKTNLRQLEILRVCPRTSCGVAELSQHEADRGEAQEGERFVVKAFPVLGQSSTAAEPGEGAFDDPALGQRDEAYGLTGPFDNLDGDARQNPFHRALELRPLVAAVGIEFDQERKAPNKLAISSAPPSRSWTSAACTMACISRPCVSTRICRFLPLIFLPAS